MESDDDDTLWHNENWGFVDVPSGIPDSQIERHFGLDARTMQNNKQRSIAQVAADLTKEALTQYAYAGREPGMSVATEIVRGIINGYGAIDPGHRFEVAYALRGIVEEFVVRELSMLVMPPRNSRMTWAQAAALVGVPESSLHYRYAPRVFNPQAKA
ncbi:hypothetical protein [Microbacterium capsulatum]|uniref:Uncharacterized protein n=1 Tax=Microbacterium capsulatum TaxID=3041921 RepID=A0ABU0XG83_9MICO|nr:hypothetical protein [Microbacterium sp. ASV81]MDQ4214071.1 hypothetical protein [Microbacterium sp. ASV81]